ncbi:hypothetical protein [Streptomyces lomondensis]|uniref:Uncharacterized protein n=1 Tax=Streptomyces lomondensis TaxID=68229 RepID=A0ABQ2X1L8_9ACTN|nr:hypothetical protein [Streptomyces lomondensis]MCF0081647.1 hypothetical protein [Streptomyces lomondensis]GGW92136.1 hypothetical protein GCM10010383_22450 [Streptomyces lomondensis]
MLRLVLALCSLTAVFATATPARAADAPAPTQAAYLAERLRENPVYVSDQLPRAVPRSTAPDFARLAKRTGVPTYVLVLPLESVRQGKELLGAVHDRLGRDGLYVLVDDSSVTDAAAYGVRAPADDAWTAQLYELPYDAGPLLSFERFADVIAQGPEKASARAEAAREKYEGDEPAAMYIGQADRRNQSFLTGVLLTSVPLLILLTAAYVRRLRRRRYSGSAKSATARAGRRIPAGVAVVTAALIAAVAVALTALAVFDQTRSSATEPPTPAELSARVERVAAGLKQDPVYADPESPRVLDARQLDRLHDRIRDFRRSDGGGPVYVSLVPQTHESEAAGDAELFAAAVRAKVGEDGVYVVADPGDGTIDVYNHGLRLDANHLALDLPESIELGDSRADDADDHLLGERLDALMTFLDETPRTDRPTEGFTPAPAPSSAEETALPPLFATDFWPGLAVGVFAALLLSAVLAGVTALVLRRRRPAPVPAHLLPLTAPTEPSASYLRRTAYTEISALAREFTQSGERSPRAGDCLDAALLLVDGDPDRARKPGLDPATLVAVIALARAGRAALAGEKADLCCGVNPLHGPGVSLHHVRVATEGNSRRLLPVCEYCRNTAIADPRGVPALLMRLPASSGGGRVPYYEATDGPLAAVPKGIARLIDRVRETAGVH